MKLNKFLAFFKNCPITDSVLGETLYPKLVNAGTERLYVLKRFLVVTNTLLSRIEHRSSFSVAFNFNFSMSSLKVFMKSEPEINVNETSLCEHLFPIIFEPYGLVQFLQRHLLVQSSLPEKHGQFLLPTVLLQTFSPPDLPHEQCWTLSNLDTACSKGSLSSSPLSSSSAAASLIETTLS